MSGDTTSSVSFFAPAFILAHGEAARLFHRTFSDHRSLLEMAVTAARKSERVTRVIVLSHDRPVIDAASKLGAEGIHYHHDEDLMKAVGDPPAFITSLAYPFLTSRHFDMLARLRDHTGAHRIEAVTTAPLHPIGAFVPVKGRMDFSQTLDRSDWKILEETRCYVRHPHLLTLVARRFDPTRDRTHWLLADERSSIRIDSVADFDLAAMAYAGGFVRRDMELTPWISL